MLHWFKRLFTSRAQQQVAAASARAEAIASAAMFLTETIADIQVRTTYGLTHAGVAAMFRCSADHLIQNSDTAETEAEKAGLLFMGKEIIELAARIEAKQK
ncbi:hypothetical protein [Thiothrix sp.]|jgi:hypothetical protein|uniref:hypothetical protein n=1 Tax=Thiothrix sp. TaxID=1032 RepID=UPI00257DB6E1|nr:hypothetical protein [Thiothrix sp.]